MFIIFQQDKCRNITVTNPMAHKPIGKQIGLVAMEEISQMLCGAAGTCSRVAHSNQEEAAAPPGHARGGSQQYCDPPVSACLISHLSFAAGC